MKKRLNIYLIILAFVISVASTAHAITYTFTPIDYPGAISTWVTGINDSGDIVGFYGYSVGYSHGFLKVGGSFTSISDVPGAQGTAALGINNSGDIVGCYGKSTDLPNYSHGFLKVGGSFTPIDYPGARSTLANGINNSGDIVGYYFDSEGFTHGFLKVGGSFTTIDHPVAISTWVTGINDSGDIVGYYTDCTDNVCGLPHGFLKVGGSFTTINVPDVPWNKTLGINNSGDIVGYCLNKHDNMIYNFLATPKIDTNISISSVSISFGNVNVGQSSNQNITITNQASSTAVLTGIVGTLSSPFSVVSGGGAFNLPPGQSVTVTVQFSPTTAGTASAILSITHNATNQNNPVMVALSGTGQSSTYTLTVTKSGTGSGTVTSSPAGINCGTNCTENVKPGKKITLKAKADSNSIFTGWSRGGYLGTGTYSVVMNADIAVTAAFSTKVPAISVSLSSLDFGGVKVGKKIAKTLKIVDTGSGNLVITLSGLDGTDFGIQGSSSVTIKAKWSYSLRVLFTPKSTGSKTATLKITSNDPNTPILDIPLNGTGQ